MQISLDILNDKAHEYQDDDYEYWFSLHSSGFIQSYAYQAGAAPFGSRPAEWAQVIRDSDAKTTRYLVRIPKSDVTPMKLLEGEAFGFNAAINDADMLERERQLEFTLGTGWPKNPSYYLTWKLVATDELE